MWKVEFYPFRHHHTNLFSSPLTSYQLPLETCFEDSDEDEEVPIFFHPLFIRTPEKISCALPPQPSTPPFNFNMEPAAVPSLLVPANLTNLVQDVLGIMNKIMDSRAAIEEEDAILQGLAELVVIMQEEAELLIEANDLVEEYCGEVEVEVEVKEMEWCFELGFGHNEMGEQGDMKRPGHESKDSGVGLDDESMLDEESEGGVDFVDDKGLEEMKPPTRRSDCLIDFYVDDRGIEETTPKKRLDKLELGSGRVRGSEAETVEIKPIPRPVLISKNARFEQKPKGTRIPKKEPKSVERQVIRKKGKEKRSTPPFRDSSLDLQSPGGSPKPRAPRWI